MRTTANKRRPYVRPETADCFVQSRRHLMDFVSFGGTGNFDVKQKTDDLDWDIWGYEDDDAEDARLQR